MSSAFAQHLQDFSSPGASMQLPVFNVVEPDITTDSAQVSVDVEHEKAMSYQEGYDAAHTELSSQHDAEKAELISQHQAELAALENKLGEGLATQIAQSLNQSIEQNCEKISQEVSGILSQVVYDSLVEMSVRQLQDVIRRTFTEKPSTCVKISGPATLLGKIQSEFSDETSNIEVTETDDVEVSVQVDQTQIETNIGEWRKTFGDNSQ